MNREWQRSQVDPQHLSCSSDQPSWSRGCLPVILSAAKNLPWIETLRIAQGDNLAHDTMRWDFFEVGFFRGETANIDKIPPSYPAAGLSAELSTERSLIVAYSRNVATVVSIRKV